jgi:tetratricopeptide (TPR) repeat protein
VQLYETTQDTVALAREWSNVGVTLRDAGDYAGARAAFETGTALARASDAPHHLAILLDNHASLLHVLEEDGALALYEESLQLKRALHMSAAVAVTLSNLAVLHGRVGNWDVARELTEEVCPLFRASGNRRALAIALNRLGVIYLAQNRPAEAAVSLLEALTLRQKLGNPHGVAVSLVALSELALVRGYAKEAAQLLAHADATLTAAQLHFSVDEARDAAPHRTAVETALTPTAYRKATAEGATLTDALLQKILRRIQVY